VNLELEVQRIVDAESIPSDEQFACWVEVALAGRRDEAELVIRIVDAAESQQLNRDYRGKDSSTNVLSFSAEIPEVVESALLGDLVICAEVVSTEAQQQGKLPKAHWAHMVVHGVLHLLGYDHQDDQQAFLMEELETEILMELGFDDPYLIESTL
jgi:probable rRNA maturation factor